MKFGITVSIQVVAVTTAMFAACAAPQVKEEYNEFKRVAEGHAYVARLVCPDGTPARLGNIMTLADAQKRFIDEYHVSCPGQKAGIIRVEPVGPLPDPPTGYRLIDTADWLEFRNAEKLIKSNPSEAIPKLDRLLAKWPGVVRLLYARAHANMMNGNFTAGIADFDELIRRDPDPFLRLQHAAAVDANGNPQACLAEALEVKKSADNKTDNYANLICQIGQLRVRCGDPAGKDDEEVACRLKARACCETEATK